MEGVYLLQNEIKHYDWGSPKCIPELLQIKNDTGEPYAELWMGAHRASPSRAIVEIGTTPLDALIESDKKFFLGATLAAHGGGFPYLFKLLAAEKPLSIQAHPNREQAKCGFTRENQKKIPLDGRRRNYKDANHKPEILCAISPFRALCGFRPVHEIAGLLKKLDCPQFTFLSASFLHVGEGEGYKLLLEKLFSLSIGERKKISDHIINNIAYIARTEPDFTREWELLASFNQQFPLDHALLAPLYLNLIDLHPEEAIFLPPGILHSYISGFAVELMANSDNVLRGGLTQKQVSPHDLIAILTLEPFMPHIIKPDTDGYFEYPTSTAEFRLVLIKGREGEIKKMSLPGPVILVLIAGALVMQDKDGAPPRTLQAGESMFIAAGASRDTLILTGTYTLSAAYVPASPRMD
ncbi:MAG: mannose-6-phosphate isomerase, class I [Spirochaetaceae bacterium]|jgi:mannose-6-phosphate isomerase|nr:mannose-6-phosphate isomerase, class I [Spirochaetaceae bacterium]